MEITRKHFAKTVLVTIVFVIVIIQACYWTVALCAKGRIFDSVEDIPYNEVGMVLGTGPTTITGETNLFFLYRIDAVEKLYKAGKIKFILISGDNSRKDYSEPDIMRDSLVARGVPPEEIYLDYAGFRTWDSVVRAKMVFGQSKMTVISQQFHNERSLFIGNHSGMELVGYNAKDTPSRWHVFRAYFRESFARVMIFVDIIINRQPRFLGEHIEIGEGKPQMGTNPMRNKGAQKLMSITKNDALTIYYPNYSKIDFVCEEMPSPQNDSVLLCCEAAFTGKERLSAKSFRHDHIAGNHVSNGTLYKGYRCTANTGCFAYYANSGSWQFAHKDYKDCIRKAVECHGMAFGQSMIIFNGIDVHAGLPCKDTSRNLYRALCEINGKLCIVDANLNMAYIDFIHALLAAGVKHALYLDMGSGWNYSFYRDNKGPVKYIHNYRIPYTTNWLTFYK